MKLFIAIPCMDFLDKPFVQSLIDAHKPCDTQIVLSESSLVYVSRQRLCEQAIESGCDYTLWLDSDMIFKVDFIDRMFKSLGDDDIISAQYFTRRPPFKPCFYSKLRMNFQGGVNVDIFYDYPKNKKIEVEGFGFGGVLMKTSMLKAVYEKYGTPFAPLLNGLVGEDLSFCIRARQMGYKLYLDTSIKMSHISSALINEDTYEQCRRENVR